MQTHALIGGSKTLSDDFELNFGECYQHKSLFNGQEGARFHYAASIYHRKLIPLSCTILTRIFDSISGIRRNRFLTLRVEVGAADRVI